MVEAQAARADGTQEREWLDLREVAEQFGISVRRAQELALAKRLPAIRQGRRWRVSRRGLDKLHDLASRQFEPGDDPALSAELAAHLAPQPAARRGGHLRAIR